MGGVRDKGGVKDRDKDVHPYGGSYSLLKLSSIIISAFFQHVNKF